MDASRSYKSCIFAFLAACIVWALSACRGIGAVPAPTATAQAVQVIALATRMAKNLQTTQQVAQAVQLATVQARQTQEAAAQAARLATVQARQTQEAAARQWPTVIYDPFNDNANQWPTTAEKSPLAETQPEIRGGKYSWQAKAVDGFASWVTPEVEVKESSIFYLAADVQQTSGSETGESGIVFRQKDGSYYLFEVTKQGRYAVYLYLDREWYILRDLTTSPAIRAGKPNRLAVIAQGDDFQFFINDQMVDSLADANLPAGSAGIMLGLSNSGEEGTWEFDNFELRAPPPQ